MRQAEAKPKREEQLYGLRRLRAEAVAEIARLIALVDGIDGADLEPGVEAEPTFCDLRGGTLIGCTHG